MPEQRQEARSAAQGHDWADIRRAAQLGQGAVYVTTDVGDGQLFHVVLTRDRLEKLAGYDPGHNERDFPHAHLYVGGDDAPKIMPGSRG